MYAIRIDHIEKLEKDYIFETDIGITDNHQATAREVKPTVIAEFLINHSHLIAHLDIRKAIVMKLQLMEQFCIARGWKRYEFRTKPIHPLSGLFDEKRLVCIQYYMYICTEITPFIVYMCMCVYTDEKEP